MIKPKADPVETLEAGIADTVPGSFTELEGPVAGTAGQLSTALPLLRRPWRT